MKTTARTIKARSLWLQCYEQLGSVSKAARKCGIPRSTLYRWINRFKTEGKQGLQGYSKRPKRLAKQKINTELIELIKTIRIQFDFGRQRISIHLNRIYNLSISAATSGVF